MRRDQMYRCYCGDCKELIRWQEPSGRRVDKIQCPKCGRLCDAVMGSKQCLEGELEADARTFVAVKQKGR